ncbi:hypothetical protein N0V94_009040, partial [Neodidymelliopsis sp. IMI 364377]
MFSLTGKENLPPDLKRALSLLHLTSLSDLEEHFLSTPAFLSPWSHFRDTFLLVHPSLHTEPNHITRLDILWFYTQYDEGIRRHDPRSSTPIAELQIDKQSWTAADLEKHLFAWLLQTFCVGKAYNPFGFQYFELRNICTAWEEVFMPIIKAVRASYSVKGRRHYGRLALFIEEKSPSRLAFPEGNVAMPDGVVRSPTPFRMVSRPLYVRGASRVVLTKKNYDETERELRSVYPQYGGLVERPRFRQRMEEWLEVQRVRAAHRKTVGKPEMVQCVSGFRPQVVQLPGGEGSLDKDNRSRSPIKRYSDTIRRSLSMSVSNSRFGRSEPSPLEPTRLKTPDTPKVSMIPYGLNSYMPKLPKQVSVLRNSSDIQIVNNAQEPKSPLHGVTRQIHVPGEASHSPELTTNACNISTHDSLAVSDAWPLPSTHLPRPQLPRPRTSEQSVYASIRESNPFSTETPKGLANAAERSSNQSIDSGSIYSPMGVLSAIPSALHHNDTIHNDAAPNGHLQPKNSPPEPRHPSYEGNGYQDEICLADLHLTIAHATETDKVPSKQHSRLLAPIRIPPYNSQLRVASNDTYRANSPPKPKALPWPGFEDALPRSIERPFEDAPPIPAKGPERHATIHSHSHSRTADFTSHDLPRIISKQNIRAALGNLSRETSIEELKSQ